MLEELVWTPPPTHQKNYLRINENNPHKFASVLTRDFLQLIISSFLL